MDGPRAAGRSRQHDDALQLCLCFGQLSKRLGARWHVTGDSCRSMPFRALNLSPKILQAVEDAGYTEPTPIQVAAIPHILAGDDVIGIAQTGTGKTAAFVWPILMKLAESKETVTQAYNAARNRQSGS